MANEDLQQKLQAKMRVLTNRYLNDLTKRIDDIENLTEQIDRNGIDNDSRQALRYPAHYAAGTGGSYGFPVISQSGRTLEDAILSPDRFDTKDIVRLSQDLIRISREIIARHHAENPETAVIPPQAEPAQPQPVKQSSSLPLVLIVDDDELIHQACKELLSADARLIFGKNTDEALDAMREHKPDLVLLDDMMPGGITGLSFLEGLQDNQELSKIPIIMITASSRPKDVMRGLVAGAADYIAKPIDYSLLGEKIRQRLNRLNTKILVVDDDETVRDLLDHKFSFSGCKMLQAENGNEAWDLIHKNKPDLILLDRMMPGIDGIALLGMMKQNPELKNIPVIFLTARDSNADVLEGFGIGAVDYIPKPFNPDEVVARCMRIIQATERKAS
ncbi:MAG: response regulator [Alphaproteobacteria bacterium]|nr:MAG: response regulator [Alphaproteobacteria bacterium]